MVAETSESNPQIVSGEFSPLATLIEQSCQRYGDFSGSSITGDVAQMFLQFANGIIEDVRSHPYWDGTALHYYRSIDEIRPIPDEIIRTGLQYYYGFQQMSAKTAPNSQMYAYRMAQILYNRRFGNQPIRMKVVDGGSKPLGFKEEPINDGLILRDE